MWLWDKMRCDGDWVVGWVFGMFEELRIVLLYMVVDSVDWRRGIHCILCSERPQCIQSYYTNRNCKVQSG